MSIAVVASLNGSSLYENFVQRASDADTEAVQSPGANENWQLMLHLTADNFNIDNKGMWVDRSTQGRDVRLSTNLRLFTEGGTQHTPTEPAAIRHLERGKYGYLKLYGGISTLPLPSSLSLANPPRTQLTLTFAILYRIHPWTDGGSRWVVGLARRKNWEGIGTAYYHKQLQGLPSRNPRPDDHRQTYPFDYGLNHFQGGVYGNTGSQAVIPQFNRDNTNTYLQVITFAEPQSSAGSDQQNGETRTWSAGDVLGSEIFLFEVGTAQQPTKIDFADSTEHHVSNIQPGNYEPPKELIRSDTNGRFFVFNTGARFTDPSEIDVYDIQAYEHTDAVEKDTGTLSFHNQSRSAVHDAIQTYFSTRYPDFFTV